MKSKRVNPSHSFSATSQDIFKHDSYRARCANLLVDDENGCEAASFPREQNPRHGIRYLCSLLTWDFWNPSELKTIWEGLRGNNPMWCNNCPMPFIANIYLKAHFRQWRLLTLFLQALTNKRSWWLVGLGACGGNMLMEITYFLVLGEF